MGYNDILMKNLQKECVIVVVVVGCLLSNYQGYLEWGCVFGTTFVDK